MLDYVTVTGGVMTDEEIQAYVDHVQEKNPQRKLKALNIEMDGEFVNLNYTFEEVPFEHIRRITGYLVGDMSHWNNAKQIKASLSAVGEPMVFPRFFFLTFRAHID